MDTAINTVTSVYICKFCCHGTLWTFNDMTRDYVFPDPHSPAGARHGATDPECVQRLSRSRRTYQSQTQVPIVFAPMSLRSH